MFKNLKPPPSHLMKYVNYINNTQLRPLPIEAFDDDFAPVGQKVRHNLLMNGIIYYDKNGGLWLRPDLIDKESIMKEFEAFSRHVAQLRRAVVIH